VPGGSKRSEIAWLRYFKSNPQISGVKAIRMHSDYIFVLLEGDANYLAILDRATGNTKY
jgi:hypothetical protein